MLALAASVARSEGLADPVPVTEIYADLPEADEGHCQQAVVDHLGLADWARLPFQDENDFLGPTARDGLHRRGLLWPPAVHTKANVFRAVGPGSLLTGKGGDEVFGDRRATPWAHLSRRTARCRGAAAKAAIGSLLPRPARYPQALAELRRAQLQRWLRPAVADRHLRLAAADQASEPLRWDRSLLWVTRRRASALAALNYRLLAAEYGVTAIDPLLDPRFLAALGRRGGWRGSPGRTASMSALFGDLLPRAVMERPTKAVFNRAFLGALTREFARDWDGTGVDPALVDIDRLREEWLSERPSALSGALLQSAWLGTTTGERSQGATTP